jgi:hypothetical protein
MAVTMKTLREAEKRVETAVFWRRPKPVAASLKLLRENQTGLSAVRHRQMGYGPIDPASLIPRLARRQGPYDVSLENFASS